MEEFTEDDCKSLFLSSDSLFLRSSGLADFYLHTKHPVVHSQPSLERKLVGRIGPRQLLRLINDIHAVVAATLRPHPHTEVA